MPLAVDSHNGNNSRTDGAKKETTTRTRKRKPKRKKRKRFGIRKWETIGNTPTPKSLENPIVAPLGPPFSYKLRFILKSNFDIYWKLDGKEDLKWEDLPNRLICMR